MAWTAPKVAATEHREPFESVETKAEQLAKRIKKSKHFIVFTGAGISTSTGIPDFRGPEGQWTLMAQGRKRTGTVTSALQAIPSPSHMALVELQNRGLLKHVISQNCDGLHRKSGIAPERISELHGNSNREYCKDCGKDYIRDFRAVATYEHSINDHRTGRKCALCNGDLLDTIINFGESLPEKEMRQAHQHARKADLCLVLGSALTVTPANTYPEMVGKRTGAALVICNLQETPLDQLANTRVFSEADTLMIKLMEKLDIPIPVFVLRRQLVVRVESGKTTRSEVTVLGVDLDGTPATFLRSVALPQYRRTAREEPFLLGMRGEVSSGTELMLNLEFMGHYGEPNLELVYKYTGKEMEEAKYLLEYSIYEGKWNYQRVDSLSTDN